MPPFHSIRCLSQFVQSESDYNNEIDNGDLDVVRGVDAKTAKLTADFEGRVVVYGIGEPGARMPAYAATIHTAHGSDHYAVLIQVTTQPHSIPARNLLYTGHHAGQVATGGRRADARDRDRREGNASAATVVSVEE